MKVRNVLANNHKRAFEVGTAHGVLPFPYSECDPAPTPDDRITRLYVDPELAREGFTYELESGQEGSVLLDQVLYYNEDPAYLADLMTRQLTGAAQKRFRDSRLSVREICRRLGTSASQLYRLLDVNHTRKPLDQMLKLLCILECKVTLRVDGTRAHVEC